jgi:hypothetical protein
MYDIERYNKSRDELIDKMWKHRCDGQPSEDYKVILQSGKWLVLDVGGDHVIPIVYCPYCGKELLV